MDKDHLTVAEPAKLGRSISDARDKGPISTRSAHARLQRGESTESVDSELGDSTDSRSLNSEALVTMGVMGASGAEEDDDDSDYDEEDEAGFEAERAKCCLSGPRTMIRAVMFVPFYQLLLSSKGKERILHKRVMNLWTLLGVVAAFFASIAHVGVVESPDFVTTDIEYGLAWDDLYVIGFLIAVVVNLTVVFLVAFLMLLMTYVPRGSAKYSLGKVLYLMVLPAHFVFLGFWCMLAAFIFLSRLTYADSPETYKVAALGFAVGVVILILGYAYMALTRPRATSDNDEDKPGFCSHVLRHTLGLLTFGHAFYALTKSAKLKPIEISKRATELWMTASIVGSVLGAAAFEGLWNRPRRADGSPDTDPLVEYSLFMYLAVTLNMCAVLTAALLLVTDLFYPGQSGTMRLIKRLSSVVGVSYVFLVAAVVAFVAAIPFMTLHIYGSDDLTWIIVLACTAGGATLLTVILIMVFVFKPSRKEEREHSGFTHIFTLCKTWERMLNSKFSSTSLYARVSAMLSMIAIVSSLLVFISFLLCQTFGEYTSADIYVQHFATASLLALFFGLAATFTSVIFNFIMSLVAKRHVRDWLRGRVNLLLMPALLLLLSVAGLLTSLPFLSLILYPDRVFYASLAFAGVTFLAMLFLRLYIIGNVPSKPNEDTHLEIRPGRFLAKLTNASLFSMLIKSSLPEAVIFYRLRAFFNALAITAALLAVISVDGFREVPSEIQANTTELVPLHSKQTPGPGNASQMFYVRQVTKAEESGQVELYAISSLMSLGMNLLTMFLGSFYAALLALAPRKSLKSLVYRIRHTLFVPCWTLLTGSIVAIVSWWTLCEVQYDSLGLTWTIRGITIAAGVLLLVVCLFVVITTNRIAKAQGHSTFQSRPGSHHSQRSDIEAMWVAGMPWCCEQGICGYFSTIFLPWHRQLLDSGCSGQDLYDRLESLWSSLALISALVTAMAFLAIQEGLTTGTKGEEPELAWKQLYITCMYLCLCVNVCATVISTFYLSMLSFVSESVVPLFLDRLGTISTLPTVLLWAGSILLFVAFPTLVQSLYGPTYYKVARIVAWIAAALIFSSVTVIHLLRGRFIHWFYRTHVHKREQDHTSLATNTTEINDLLGAPKDATKDAGRLPSQSAALSDEMEMQELQDAARQPGAVSPTLDVS